MAFGVIVNPNCHIFRNPTYSVKTRTRFGLPIFEAVQPVLQLNHVVNMDGPSRVKERIPGKTVQRSAKIIDTCSITVLFFFIYMSLSADFGISCIDWDLIDFANPRSKSISMGGK